MSIGCHYLITTDGVVHKGRDESQNCNFDPKLDKTAINIRLVGFGWNANQAQMLSMFNLEDELLVKYPEAEVCEYLPQDPRTK